MKQEKAMYAIIQDGTRQYKVTKGELVTLDLKKELSPGKKINFPKVLLFADKKNIKVGNPLVSGVQVAGEVTEHVKGKKITVQKFKRRKSYHIKKGHRQKYTVVKITQLSAT